MSVSLGNVYFELGLDDKGLTQGLENAKKKLSEISAIGSEGINTKGIFKEYIQDLTRVSDISKSMSAFYKEQARDADQVAAAQNRIKIAAEAAQSKVTQGLFQSHIQGLTQTSSVSQAMSSYYRDLEKQSDSAIKSQEAATKAADKHAAAQKRMADTGLLVNKTFTSQNVLFSQLSTVLGTTFSIYAVGAFVKQLARVSGEFELQQVALRAIVGDAEKADQIFNQVKQLAVESPFQFKDLVGFTKQLAAFSVPANELFGTMTRLADVSAGLGVDMGRIVLAYGQVRAATVLRGQELRQFTEAGIPLVDKLAQKLSLLEGKTITAGDVFERISKRMISFKMVDQIFTDMTASGGMFFEMQKKQADTLAGKLSNLTDAYQIMLNSIGKENSGSLKGGVDVITSMLSNWKEIADILKVIIAGYGAYKVAVLAVNTVESISASIQAAKLVIMEANVAANITMTASELSMAAATQVATTAFAGLEAVMIANPIAVIASVVAALGVALYITNKNAHELDNALNKTFDEYSSGAEKTITQVSRLSEEIKNSAINSDKRNEAIKSLNSIMGPYLTTLIKETDSYDSIKKSIDGATSSIYANAAAKGYAASVTVLQDKQGAEIKSAEKTLRDALTKDYGIGQDVATSIIRGIFSGIRENPELGKNTDSLMELVKNELQKASANPKNKINIDIATLKGTGGVSGADNYFKGFYGVQQYANSINDLNSEMLIEQQRYSALSGVQTDYLKSVNDENKLYADNIAALKAKGYQGDAQSVKRQRDIDGMDNEKAHLTKLMDIYDKAGQQDKVREIAAKLQGLEKPTDALSKFLANVKQLETIKPVPKLFDIQSLIQDGDDFAKVAEKIATAYESSKKEYQSMLATNAANQKAGLLPSWTNEQVDNAKQTYLWYKAINEQALGQVDKGDVKQSKKDELEKERKAKALEKLNAQILASEQSYADSQKTISEGEIRNDEDSYVRAMAINEKIASMQREKLAKTKQSMLDQATVAAGYKIGSAQQITSFDAVTGDAKVNAALIQGKMAYQNEVIKIEEDLSKANFATKNKYTEKAIILDQKITASAKTEAEKEKADIEKRYAEIQKERIRTSPAGTVTGTDKVSLDLKDKQGAEEHEVDVKYGLIAIEYQKELKLKLNAIKYSGAGQGDKLRNANYAAEQTYLIKKIALEETSNTEQSKQNTELDKTLLNLSKVSQSESNLQSIISKIGGGLSALNNILEQNQTVLGISDRAMQNIKGGMSVAAGTLSIISGNVVAGIGQIAGALMQFIIPSRDKISAVFIALQQKVDQLISSINLATKTLSNIGAKVPTSYILGILKAQLDDVTVKAAALNKHLSEAYYWMRDVPTTSYVAMRKQVDDLAVSLQSLTSFSLGTGMDAALPAIEAVLNSYNSLKEAIDNIVTDLTGTSVKDLSNSLADVFWNGISAAEDWGKAVDDIIKKVIIDQLTSKLLTAPIQKAIDQLVTDATSADKTFVPGAPGKPPRTETSVGLSLAEADKFKQTLSEIAAINGPAFEAARKMLESMGIISPTSATSTAAAGLQGAIKGVTEDTANLLSSLLNAIRGDVSLQNISLKSMEDILGTTQNLTANSLAQLVKIEANTYNLLVAMQGVIGGKGSQGDGIRVWA